MGPLSRQSMLLCISISSSNITMDATWDDGSVKASGSRRPLALSKGAWDLVQIGLYGERR